MALAPKFAGQRLVLGNSPAKTLHTVELCKSTRTRTNKTSTTSAHCKCQSAALTSSAKQFNTVYDQVVPKLKSNSYANKVQFILRQQVQPWHPSSTLVHEAGIAVLQLAPDKYWEFSSKLFKKQQEYFDVNVVNETRNETYTAEVGIDEGKIYSLLQVADKPDKDGSLNIGNKVTNDLKLQIKAARLLGVHVSPTVIFNVVND